MTCNEYVRTHTHMSKSNTKWLHVQDAIIQDDVAPARDFVERLWDLVVRELPCDWQALSLGGPCSYS